MFGLSIGHWVIVLVVVILLFGTARLRNIGGDLGAAIKSFKSGLKEDAQSNQELTKDDTMKSTIIDNKTDTSSHSSRL